MAYDAESDRIILFGGNPDPADRSVVSNETWAYDFNADTWTEMSPGESPPGLGSAAMAYDSQSDRVIMFGGSQSGFAFSGGTITVTNDTWAYDFNTNNWTQMSNTSSPSPRCCAPLAYDSQSDLMILHGGYILTPGSLGDTWTYDYDADQWEEVSPSERPRSGDSAAIAYDEDSDRVILFGGAWGGTSLPEPHGPEQDTWSYDHDGNAWSNMDPSPRPSLRWAMEASYTSASDRMVVFGGLGSLLGGALRDTWAYDFNANRWTDMNSAAPPSKRCCQATAYDSESDQIVLFGGADPDVLLDTQDALGDTWAYQFAPNLPTAPLDFSLVAGNAEVEVQWGPPRTDAGSAITGYNVYRGTTSTDLSLAGELVSGPTFADGGLSNGVEYFYHVRAVNEAGEGPASQVLSAAPEDTVDPLIAISSPTEGATLSVISVTVTGTASDDGVLESVELSTDGVDWTPAAISGPTWSGTLTLIDGENTIHARATDARENTATDTVRVLVELPLTDGPDFTFLIAVLSGVGIAVAAGVVLLVLRRRKR